MKVTKRDGSTEDINFNKIATRIKRLTHSLSSDVSGDLVAQKVMSSLYDGISAEEIDTLSAETAIALQTDEPDYEKLAARLTASNIQKRSPPTFMDAMKAMFKAKILSKDVWESMKSCERDDVNGIIKKNRDADINFFGLKTLEKGYLTQINSKLIETPQYLFLRVAWGIHNNIEDAKETYNMMSQGYFIHATPTLFNSGTIRPQMSSCFLKAMDEDSIDGIYETIKKVAKISKWSGGIGLHTHNVRANKSHIEGTNGTSDGIIPMLRVLNATARYVNQGGKRKGSVAVYLEPWHADILQFLDLRLNQGDEEARCRDLFSAMWIPDAFMQRVKDGGDWHLFCPNEVRKAHGKCLSDVYGQEFEELYQRCANTPGLVRKTVPAETVWKAIVRSQIETGTPYMLYKDACNQKSNQKNIGIIKSSNLCTEILEVSNKDETAVCNLASLALPKYVDQKNNTFNYSKLESATRMLVRNLNRVIDKNYYPTDCAKNSNMLHRPIGLGVQGLADVFMLLGHPFDSQEAKDLNKMIFEHIYYAAVSESMELAKKDGAYEKFKGSPLSEGKFQFDLWGVEPSLQPKWDKLRKDVMEHGVRNSLLVAPMPTASTSQILGNNECFEPYTTNIYLRRTLAGEFVVINKHLVKALKELGMWNKHVKDGIIRSGGSVQGFEDLGPEIKAVFKTVWEISQKCIIDMAADRGAFVDQSQSMNLFLESPTMSKISSMHMYAWQKGLKTGMYYLRSKAKSRPIQFTLEPCETCSA
jgi:ribonucleoside-diphosphate reductase alpha subunit